MAFVGIDLGTTNSAIASYDGNRVHLYKSPEQHDVTPSAIYVTKRARYVGRRAYDQAAADPKNAATLFKRFMGTSTPIHLTAINQTISPVDASAEVLASLVSYLPEDLRNDPETGTVITIPAAFNQLQRDATLSAANQASIGKVALMQEPVAAVMSVMAEDKSDGIFLVYDLGGGTLDIAIAESIGGRVSLLAHGGIGMLGGRDMDRMLFDSHVKPWLYQEFNLPIDARQRPEYDRLFRVAIWATEKAKIELSQRDDATVSLAEEEVRVQDLDGDDVYLDVPVSRRDLDRLIQRMIDDSVGAARDAMRQAGVGAVDVSKVVFVGGPTQYPPLRERVTFELGIDSTTRVNPMTAVATGAAIFAESIDWSQKERGRKATQGALKATAQVSFKYDSRTPRDQARVVVKVEEPVQAGMQIQFDSLATGWTSGRMPLASGQVYRLDLPAMGGHRFRVQVLDGSGIPVTLDSDQIEITRTAASIEAIPASHTISIEAREKAGGPLSLFPLVRSGEHLPASGTINFVAERAIAAGSDDALNFKLWEGEIKQPIDDNTFIGVMKVAGTDLSGGHIPVGAELHCHYRILDSGNVTLEVEIPALGTLFKDKGNFYSRQDAEVNFSGQDQVLRIREEQESILRRIEDLEEQVSDRRLDEARARLERIDDGEMLAGDAEVAKQSSESVQEAKRLLAQVRNDNRIEILQQELDAVVKEFNEEIRPLAEPTEETQFDNLSRSAQRAVDEASPLAEERISELRSRILLVLWRQDWFIREWFDGLIARPWLFEDQQQFAGLVAEGQSAITRGDANRLRGIVWELNGLRFGPTSEDDATLAANIIYRRHN